GSVGRDRHRVNGFRKISRTLVLLRRLSSRSERLSSGSSTTLSTRTAMAAIEIRRQIPKLSGLWARPPGLARARSGTYHIRLHLWCPMAQNVRFEKVGLRHDRIPDPDDRR